MTSTARPEWWIETTLNDSVSLLWDGLHWTPIYDDTWEYFFINWNNLDNWNINIKDDTKRVSVEEYDKYKKDLNDRTILVSINWTLWNYALYKWEKVILWKSACYFNVKDEIDKDYIKYVIISDAFQKYLTRDATGTTIKNVSLQQMRNYKFLLPSLPEQKAISWALSSFDKKIELLKSENKTLEEMWENIFKEWFGKYKSGEELPRGWENGKISDLWNIVCWKTPDKSEPSYYWWDIPFIKIPDMHWNVFLVKTEDSLSKIGANTQNNKYIPEWSVCVSCIATVWLVSITTKDSQTNQQINSIIPNNKNSLEYIYYTMMWMYNYLQWIWSWWSATLNINTWVFSNIEVIIPESDVIEKFHSLVWPLFEKIRNNAFQIEELFKTRNQLLSKLMSWEIRVSF